VLVRLGANELDETEYIDELVDAVESWRSGPDSCVGRSACARLREDEWAPNITGVGPRAGMRRLIQTGICRGQLVAYLLVDEAVIDWGVGFAKIAYIVAFTRRLNQGRMRIVHRPGRNEGMVDEGSRARRTERKVEYAPQTGYCLGK
jgi:hypothetical protein